MNDTGIYNNNQIKFEVIPIRITSQQQTSKQSETTNAR